MRAHPSGTDTPSVVSVTAAGVVTGLASGEATVFVDVQGQVTWW